MSKLGCELFQHGRDVFEGDAKAIEAIGYLEALLLADVEQQWTGEGLPPVGTVCEYRPIGASDAWRRVEILLHIDGEMATAAVFIKPGARVVTQAIAECFRPIRTPEQIATEKREDFVRGAMFDTDSKHDPYMRTAVFRELYDAGYRKQVAP